MFGWTAKYELSLDSLNILDGRDYQINIQLLGNTHATLGMIDSSNVVEISKMKATKPSKSFTVKVQWHLRKVCIDTSNLLP